MYAGIALGMWAIGLWCTYIAMINMGASPPLLIALIVQVMLSLVQSLLMVGSYRVLPSVQQKIILFFAVLFFSFDVWLNFNGIAPTLGDISTILPSQIVASMGVHGANTVATGILAIGISVLPEILFTVAKENRKHRH